MKSYDSISYGRRDKDSYAKTPIDNGQMNSTLIKITWWMGIGLFSIGILVSYKEMFGGSSSSFTQVSKLVQKVTPQWFTTSSTTDLGTMPSYRLRRVGYSSIKLDHDFLRYKFLEGMSDVIEPYVPTELNVDNYADSSVYYAFSMCKSGGDSSECYYGKAAYDNAEVSSATVTVPCKPFEVYDFSVDQVESATGSVLTSATTQATCMYVRRELRSLTPDDLAKAMDALYTVYSVSDEEGQKQYGSEYHNYAYALHFHHFNAAWRESDHIHEGNGFAPQHIKMTNLVETSMQMVDPSVSLPYWDFTIDHANNRVSFNSDVFTESIFGGLNRPADLFKGFSWENDPIATGQIASGRWAGLKAETNEIYPELRNGFGYMRAPWNMNPSPYVSRFAAELQIGVQLPSCTQHYDILSYTKRMEFLYDIQNGPHATTHALTGGTYGCDLLYPMLEAGYITNETSLKYICSTWVFSLKEFYRYNFITPFESCTVADDIDSSVCGFTCTTDASSLQEFKMNMEQKLSKYVPSDMGEDGWAAWTEFICNGDGWRIFSGDHLESASPADPSFWSIHPTLERLMHAKSMAGGFEDETGDWVLDSKDETVCDKAECYMEEEGARGHFEGCCLGHFENDATLNFVTGDKSDQWGATNREVLDATNPTLSTYSMPYIYDGFTWDHCDDDFETLLANVKAGIATQSEEKTSLLGPDSEVIDPSTLSSTTATISSPSAVLSGSQQTSLTGPSAVMPGTLSSPQQQQQQPIAAGGIPSALRRQ